MGSMDEKQPQHSQMSFVSAISSSRTLCDPGDGLGEIRTPVLASPPTEEAPWKPSRHKLLIMITLATGCLAVALDASVTVTALTAIVQDLECTATEGFWIGTAYLLATAVVMPFVSSLSDIFGRPICLEVAILFFTIGSLMCALAKGITLLLIGRVIQGVGGGGIVVLGLVIFTDIVPLRFRPKWYGIVLGAWALGNSIGPTIGGAIAQYTTWRWVYYIMLPFCGYSLVAVPILLTLKPQRATLAEKLAKVDWIGNIVFMGSATSLLIAISCGGTQHPWGSAQTIVPLVLGVAGLAATLVWEVLYARNPFLNYRVFTTISSAVTYFNGMLQGLLLFGQLYYVPFFFLAAKEFKPIWTGVAMLPVLVILTPVAIVTGAIVSRLNNYQWPIWLGWAILSLGCGLIAFLWDNRMHTAVWVVVELIVGIGHGGILNAQNFASQAMCKSGSEGSAATMYLFMRQFGMALGVGIGGTTFQNVMSHRLEGLGLPTSIAANAEAFVNQLASLPQDAFKSNVIRAYVSGFRGVFCVYFALSIVGLLLSLFIKHYDMNKSLSTQHVLEEARDASQLFKVRQAMTSPVSPISPTSPVLSELPKLEEV